MIAPMSPICSAKPCAKRLLGRRSWSRQASSRTARRSACATAAALRPDRRCGRRTSRPGPCRTGAPRRSSRSGRRTASCRRPSCRRRRCRRCRTPRCVGRPSCARSCAWIGMRSPIFQPKRVGRLRGRRSRPSRSSSQAFLWSSGSDELRVHAQVALGLDRALHEEVLRLLVDAAEPGLVRHRPRRPAMRVDAAPGSSPAAAG